MRNAPAPPVDKTADPGLLPELDAHETMTQLAADLDGPFGKASDAKD